MQILQLTGTVTKVTTKSIKMGNDTLIKNDITISEDSLGEITLVKYTKPNTNFNIAEGTKIKANGELKEDKFGNESYKISSGAENFVMLDQQRSESKGNTKSTVKTAVDPIKTPVGNSWNGDGAKRGNALTNAVTILLHNKKSDISSKDEETLLDLARLVYRVSTRLETPETLPTTKSVPNDESTLFD